MRAFCASRMNVLFTKYPQEQAIEDTGNLLCALSMLLPLNRSDNKALINL